jgi:hypothetical protein
MSIEIIHESRPIARKNYTCNACDFLFELDDPCELGLTFIEKREVVRARQKGYKILKSERYVRQFNKDGGNTWTFRAIPTIHDICVKHDLYAE